MKTTSLILAAALSLAAPVASLAQSPVTVNDSAIVISDGGTGETVIISGDTLVAVQGSDTTRIAGLHGLKDLINGVLDDTVINVSTDDGDMVDADYYAARVARSQHDMVRSIVGWVVVFAIAVTALLVYYFNRRNKYRTIERAIDNNYPLPDEFIVGNRQQPQQPAYDGTTPPPLPGNTPAGGTNWNAYDSAVKLIALGLGGMLFFWVVDSNAMTALCSILLFLGMGKAFIIYQQQQQR